LWKRIFKSIKAIRRKEIKTNVGKTDGFSIPLRHLRFYFYKNIYSAVHKISDISCNYCFIDFNRKNNEKLYIHTHTHTHTHVITEI